MNRAALVASALSLAIGAAGQCIQLTGSSQCPGFATQFINPSGLTPSWPFFADVTDVASFDTQFAQYLTSESEFRATKYNRELGCSNTTTEFTLQYARTFLCSEFTQVSYTAGCYTGSNVARRMACQVTCLQFAASEMALVEDPVSCGATNLVGAARQGNLTKDFTSCTDWTTLTSNNTNTCVLGQVNEPNCGFGTSSTQLCGFCNPASSSAGVVDSCCGAGNVDLSSCGYTLAAAQIAPTPTGTTSLAAPTSSTTTSAAGAHTTSSSSSAAGGAGSGAMTELSGGSSLSGGAKAGIAIGVIVGVAILAAFAFFLFRKRRQAQQHANNGSPGESGHYLFGAGKSPKSAGSSISHSFASPNMMEKSGSKQSSTNNSTEAKVLIGAAGLGAAGAAAAKERPISDATGTSADSNEGRNLVSTYRDQYSSAEIAPGTEVIAIYAYNPNLPDELRLEPEMVVRVRKIFDDGWAVGTVVSGGNNDRTEGAFPLVVCTAVGADATDNVSSSDSAYSRQGGVIRRTSQQSQNSGYSANGRTSSISRTESFRSSTSRPLAPSSDEDHPDPTLRQGGFLSAARR